MTTRLPRPIGVWFPQTPLKSPAGDFRDDQRDPFAGVEAPRSGMFTLVASTGDRKITLIRNGAPDRTGSVGGWQQSERMLEEDSDWWSGPTKGALTLPFIIDVEEIGGPSMVRRIELLYSLGSPDRGGEPPALRVFGNLSPSITRPLWKLDDLKLSEEVEHPDDAAGLIRIDGTLDLSTLAIAKGVEDVTIRRTRASSTSTRRRRVLKTRQGDSLRSFAVRHLGSSGDYKKLREWNPKLRKVDPDAPLRAGTRIVLR